MLKRHNRLHAVNSRSQSIRSRTQPASDEPMASQVYNKMFFHLVVRLDHKLAALPSPSTGNSRASTTVPASPVPDAQVSTCSSSPAECRGHSLTMGQRRRSRSKPRDATVKRATLLVASIIESCRIALRGLYCEPSRLLSFNASSSLLKNLSCILEAKRPQSGTNILVES